MKNPAFLPYLARQVSKVAHEHTEHRGHDEFILVRASGE
jgi:hypothetical protein